MCSDGRSRRDGLRWLSALSVLAVVGGALAGCGDDDPQTDRSRSVVSAALLRGAGGGDALLLVDTVRYKEHRNARSRYRLDLVALNTGERRRRHVYPKNQDHEPFCHPASAGQLWCRERRHRSGRENGLVRRAARSLELLADYDALLDASPILAQAATLTFDARSGEILVRTNDSDYWLIAADGSPATRLEPGVRPAVLRRVSGGAPAGTHYADTPQGKLVLQNRGTREARLERGNEPLVGPDGAPVDEVFVDGEFLDQYPTSEPLRLPGGEALVVAHRVSRERDAPLELRAITSDGAVLWTRRDVGGNLLLAALVGDDVVVVVSGHEERTSYALALRARDGSVRWRHEI